MIMFPGAGARIFYNDSGEPIGWDYPSDREPPYCDLCGYQHGGFCPEDDDEWEED